MTITPSPRNAAESETTARMGGGSVSTLSALTLVAGAPSTAGETGPGSGGGGAGQGGGEMNAAAFNSAPTPRSLPPSMRPRCLYLPHTHLTVQALLHFVYASSLPPPSSALCTPQIMCSLLQIARPYRVDGLVEAVVERLHALPGQPQRSGHVQRDGHGGRQARHRRVAQPQLFHRKPGPHRVADGHVGFFAAGWQTRQRGRAVGVAGAVRATSGRGRAGPGQH